MKAIIDGKIYNTEKAELIREYYTNECVTARNNLFGTNSKITISRETKLYLTNKGSWFEIFGKYENLKAEIKVLNDDKVRQLFSNLNDVENYEKYFGKLKEA